MFSKDESVIFMFPQHDLITLDNLVRNSYCNTRAHVIHQALSAYLHLVEVDESKGEAIAYQYLCKIGLDNTSEEDKSIIRVTDARTIKDQFEKSGKRLRFDFTRKAYKGLNRIEKKTNIPQKDIGKTLVNKFVDIYDVYANKGIVIVYNNNNVYDFADILPKLRSAPQQTTQPPKKDDSKIIDLGTYR